MQVYTTLKFGFLTAILSFYGSFFIGTNSANAADELLQDSEKKAIETVLAIAEVKKMNRIIDSISNHKRGISIIVSEQPKNKKSGYYVIQAGNNTEDRFEVIYTFHVILPGYEAKYDDPVSGELITLKEWRKQKKQ